VKFILKFYNFLEPKWLDDLKKFEQVHKIWSYSSGFAQKKACSQACIPIIFIWNVIDYKRGRIILNRYDLKSRWFILTGYSNNIYFLFWNRCNNCWKHNNEHDAQRQIIVSTLTQFFVFELLFCFPFNFQIKYLKHPIHILLWNIFYVFILTHGRWGGGVAKVFTPRPKKWTLQIYTNPGIKNL